MSTAIEFQGVSKFFRMDRDRSRAFQELFISTLRRKRREANANLFWALRDVSFSVERGSSLGLIGANGAGKSTALKLISRIIQPSEGNVTVNGRVTALLELGAGFHPELSGRDNIHLNGAVMGLTRKEVDYKLDEIVEFAELEEFIDVPVKDYSSGMYARLGFSVAVHLDPDILLVDEVLSVGDQAFQQKCNERMLQLRKSGITILFVSHSLEAVVRTCGKAVWLDHGKLRAEGDVQRVADKYYKHVLEHQSLRGIPANGENRYGSGEARIVRVEFLDADGQPLDAAMSNAPLILRLHYRATSRVVQPTFGLAFKHTATGALMAGPNTQLSGHVIPSIEGAGRVDYRIDRLPFLPGEYLITTSIYDADCTPRHDEWIDCARLQVAPGGTEERHGLIALEGTWVYAQPAQATHPLNGNGASNGASSGINARVVSH
jgi:ABC-type polysaccharide/polyol phosphate transport system ATPase subunit